MPWVPVLLFCTFPACQPLRPLRDIVHRIISKAFPQVLGKLIPFRLEAQELLDIVAGPTSTWKENIAQEPAINLLAHKAMKTCSTLKKARVKQSLMTCKSFSLSVSITSSVATVPSVATLLALVSATDIVSKSGKAWLAGAPSSANDMPAKSKAQSRKDFDS